MVDESPVIAEEVKEESEVSRELQEKELGEIFDALDVLAGFAGKVLKDGEVTKEDFIHVVELAGKLDVILEGIDGARDALPPSVNRRFAEIAIGRTFGIIEKFKAGKEA